MGVGIEVEVEEGVGVGVGIGVREAGVGREVEREVGKEVTERGERGEGSGGIRARLGAMKGGESHF